jgi:predicted lipid-binding transport protein (Tim44 family)
MRFDLSDLDRLTGFADALERLFWCLLLVAFFTAILGSHGTGLFLLLLGAVAFIVRAGLEDFVRSRQEAPEAKRKAAPKKAAAAPKAAKKSAAAKKPAKAKRPAPPAKATPPDRDDAPEFTVYRASRKPRRKKTSV